MQKLFENFDILASPKYRELAHGLVQSLNAGTLIPLILQSSFKESVLSTALDVLVGGDLN